jgi:hypothetical protein
MLAHFTFSLTSCVAPLNPYQAQHVVMFYNFPQQALLKKLGRNPLGIPPLIKWETLISTKVDPLWKSLVIQTEWQTVHYASTMLHPSPLNSIHLPPSHHNHFFF